MFIFFYYFVFFFNYLFYNYFCNFLYFWSLFVITYFIILSISHYNVISCIFFHFLSFLSLFVIISPLVTRVFLNGSLMSPIFLSETLNQMYCKLRVYPSNSDTQCFLKVVVWCFSAESKGQGGFSQPRHPHFLHWFTMRGEN